MPQTRLHIPDYILPQALLAQVTVIDADHGDSNIIDLYQFAPGDESNFTSPLIRRSLIDTGPGNKTIKTAILDALTNRALPVRVSDRTSQFVVPPLDEIQITHTDEDHIGNAADVVKRLTQPFPPPRRTPLVVRYASIPPAMPTTVEARCVRCGDDGQQIWFNFQLVNLSNWADEMRRIELYPQFNDYFATMNYDSRVEHSAAYMWHNPNTLGFPFLHATVNTIASSVFQNHQGSFEFGFTCQMTDVKNQISGHPERKVLSQKIEFSLPLIEVLGWTYAWIESIPAPSPQPPTAQWEPSFDVQSKTLAEFEQAIKEGLQQGIVLDTPKYPQKLFRNRVNAMLSNHTDVTQTIIGPMADVDILRRRYAVLSYLAATIPKGSQSDLSIEFEIDNSHDTVNRASVITVFGRREQNFDMLFTGDAYDQESDIRHSIAMWKNNLNTPVDADDPAFRFNVLKVPHHGSARTTNAQFYDAVRADVYFICAQHSTHGNPRVSSLQAIVKGFRRPRENGENYRLFFSDPKSLEPTTRHRSPLATLLQIPGYSPSATLRYEVWVLKPSNAPERQSYGSVVFFLNNNNRPNEWFTTDEWKQVAGPPPFRPLTFSQDHTDASDT